MKSYRLWSSTPSQIQSTSDTISKRKYLIVYSLSEKETSSAVSKCLYNKIVTEHTQQLISEVRKTQKKKKQM